VIDGESERAVSRWVRLGDQITGRAPPDDGKQCESCGTTDNVLDHDEHALCAHCYLEKGSGARNELPNAAL
jgi:hypothetical protein